MGSITKGLDRIEGFLERYSRISQFIFVFIVAGILFGGVSMFFGDYQPFQYQKPQGYCYVSQNTTHATFQVSNSGSYPFLTDEFLVSGLEETDLKSIADIENNNLCKETTFGMKFPERPFERNITVTPKENRCVEMDGDAITVGIMDTLDVSVNPKVVEGETHRIVRKWEELPYDEISGAAVIIEGLKDKQTKKAVACEMR